MKRIIIIFSVIFLTSFASAETSHFKNNGTSEIRNNSVSEEKDAFDKYVNLGESFYKNGKIRESIAYYQKALFIDPENYEVNLTLGTINNLMGQLEEALPYLEKAAAVNLDGFVAQFTTGIVSKKMGQYDKALKHLTRAYEINPNHGGVCNELGEAYYSGFRNTEKAIYYLEKAIELDETDAESFGALGSIYLEMRDVKKARLNYLKAKALYKKQGDRQSVEAINYIFHNYF